ncbi:cysteine-rich receptor-like protein kinase 42 [Ipomoea triloba]|uniref:cysteine-rich receptor-like protein kinase 42 n=1 Tax=Ipomoea triloba TaxID=35885 RepID=UPI00125DDFF8|nr:cysteine-rich receptor-like protein kinase 42 [Ipomoea triloba]
MHFLSSKFPFLKWATTAVILLISTASFCYAADPRIEEAAPMNCSVNRVSPTFIIPIFTRVMEVVSQSVTDHGWGNSSTVTTNASMYALAQCYEDLPRQDCLLCYASSRTKLPRCLPGIAGRLFLDGCFLRYDNYSFFSESTSAQDKANCSSSIGTPPPPPNFATNAGRLIDNITAAAAARGGFATGNANGVYVLAQCWKTVSREGCGQCLAKARTEAKNCLPSVEGRAMNAGCYLRYSTENFISDPNETDGGGSAVSKKGVKVAIALSVIAFVMISAFIAYTWRNKALKRKQERKNLGPLLGIYSKSNLNFKYETLEKATNYFDPSMKLGQGGAGSVYKGTLNDGRVVAVKRLFFNTRQWVDEFFNEVNLISGVEHRNLVKLLGCSIEGPESLLVYEFVPNKSLDQYIFDKNKVLTWRERVHIVVGTAEGIAFLHGGTSIRIIHRDIKSSNVLLDENLAPKIADFGLARCFAPDKTHLSTGIAGTLGYMAPEYLVRGQLTEKADVYSFGVLVLEIVSGRKSNAFADDSGSLLQTVWRLYRTDRSSEVVDPSLEGDFNANEASKVVQVGLLCCQAIPALRPSMPEVVEMLTINDREIPEPTQPPFINSSVLAGGSMSSIKTLVSSALNRQDGSSYTSTTDQSSSMQSTSDGIRSEEFRNH